MLLCPRRGTKCQGHYASGCKLFFVSKPLKINIDTRNGGFLSNMAILAIYINFRKVFRKMPSKFNRLFIVSVTGSLKLSSVVRLGKSSKFVAPLKQTQFGTLCQLNHLILGGGFKDFLFSPVFGEDSHFD